MTLTGWIAFDFIKTSPRWTVRWWATWLGVLVCFSLGFLMLFGSHVVLTAGDVNRVMVCSRPLATADELSDVEPVRDDWRAYPVVHRESWDGPFCCHYTRWTAYIPIWMLLLAATALTLGLFWRTRIATAASLDNGDIVIRRCWHVLWWAKWVCILTAIVFVLLGSRASHLDITWEAGMGYGVNWSDRHRAGEYADAHRWYPTRATWGGMEPDGVDAWVILVPLWMPVAATILSALLLFRRDRQHPPIGHYLKCRYDLTGNMSGVCPECGRDVGVEK